MNAGPITSSAAPSARIVGSSVQPVAAHALPARSLGVGAFTVGTGLAGLPALVGPRGEACGLFASKHLADLTAQILSR